MPTGTATRSSATAADPARVPNVRLHELVAVRELARTLSFVDAANALGLTQPNLSRTIAALEQRLGTKLFVRNTRIVKTTEAGELLVDLCQRTLSTLESTIARIRQGEGDTRPQLRVTISVAAGARTIHAAAREYCRLNPSVDIHVNERADNEVLDAVVGGAAAIGFSYMPPVGRKLTAVPVTRERLVAVVPTRHPLTEEASEEKVQEQLRQARLISVLPDTFLQRLLRKRKNAVDGGRLDLTTVDSMEVLRLHVLTGTAIGIVPEREIPSLPSTLATIPLNDPALAVTLYVVTSRRHALQKYEDDFIETISSSASSSPAK